MSTLNGFELTLTSAGLTTATTAYTAGDCLGNEMSGTIGTSTFAVVQSAILVDKSDITGAIVLYMGDRTFSLGTDNAAPNISDANALFLTPTIYFPAPDDLGGVRAASIDSNGIMIKANASNTVFAKMVTLISHTFFGAVGDIVIKMTGFLDV